MAKHSSRRRQSRHRAPKKSRPLVATAAAIGGAGLVLAAPAAALLANPGSAHAAPTDGVTDLFGCAITSMQGGPCLTNLDQAKNRNITDSLFYYDPLLDIAGAIPVLNAFIGNGADGTAVP